MSNDYAALSYRFGVFAGKADKYLGRAHFGPKCRAKAWRLTEALFFEMQIEALELGVPVDLLDLTQAECQVIQMVLRQTKSDLHTGRSDIGRDELMQRIAESIARLTAKDAPE